MQRLLQGDVGSGKTIVAALAACQAIDAGWQAALMAPTEILAEQHYLKLAAWLEPLGVDVAWLVRQPEDARAGHAAAGGGEAQLVVGTHALIQEKVDFARLGLAIVDEQHRFGVAQRLALRARAAQPPHQLMMSATPIPRTLAMSYYADLDVSVLDELPPGRTPVKTKLVADARRDEWSPRVRAAAPAAAGLLGLPADRGVGGAATADGDRHPRRADRRTRPGCASAWCTAACKATRRRR
jgi:ATP-dependent DNA helicase RecG